MALSEITTARAPRNPGPSWGYAFLRGADSALPRPAFDFVLGLGTWVAVAVMPSERRHSRDYLCAVFGRPAGIREVWRHFFAFAQTLTLTLRIGAGQPHRCVSGKDCGAFNSLMASGRPALLGTFHIGRSDLLGFMLGDFGRHVFMIRLRVENSGDTSGLARQFGAWVTFIWVNETESLLFAVKQAIQSGGSVAMKCDRPEYSAKLEPFEFLGRRRLFPFTIYHLALIFRQPVVFCVGVPASRDHSLVRGSPVFEPDGGSKDSNLARARVHFQDFLLVIESMLRENPYLWFNFIPLNPVTSDSPEKSAPSGLAGF
jgi:predicted LPLAT superfamily acyltransferase